MKETLRRLAAPFEGIVWSALLAALWALGGFFVACLAADQKNPYLLGVGAIAVLVGLVLATLNLKDDR